MYIKAFIIVLIAVSVTAHPTDGGDEENHDHIHIHDLMEECCDLTGYTINKVYITMDDFDNELSFCDEDPAKDWITCFYKKMGAMDENHELNEAIFEEDLDDEKQGIFKSCLNNATSMDINERACTLDDCIHKNNLYDEEDYYDEHEHEHHRIHYHADHHHDHDHDHHDHDDEHDHSYEVGEEHEDEDENDNEHE